VRGYDHKKPNQEIAMKKIALFTNITLGIVLVLVLLSTRLPDFGTHTVQAAPDEQSTAVSNSTCDASRSLQVTGSAMINVTPDRAFIQLGVVSNGLTPTDVQAVNSAAIQTVINALKAEGIASKDIATDYYVIEPVYDDYNSLYIKGYRINNLVAVTLREVQKTSNVIATALSAGANQVVNLEFYTSDLRNYRDQARELAVKAALEKAKALANAAGAEVGCVLSINENSWSYYNGGWWYGRTQNMWTQNTIQNAAPANSAGSSTGDEPISLGQISIKAEISATFSLK
jgi:uncharacterized protein